MKNIKLFGDSYEENLGGYDAADDWSRDSTSKSWTIVGAGETVPVNFEKFDDIDTDYTGKCHALYAIHSGGDSFGNDENAYFTLIWVFNDLERALAAQKLIREHATWYDAVHRSYRAVSKVVQKKFKDEYSVTIKDGKHEIPVHCGWNGYFESLGELDIFTFEIKED